MFMPILTLLPRGELLLPEPLLPLAISRPIAGTDIAKPIT
jgi:hypothetical protein